MALTLLAGEAAARVLGVASFALLARALSLSDFGTFSFAMSTALIMAVVVDMGQNSHLARIVARDPDNGANALSRVFLNKARLGILTIAVSAAGFCIARFSAAEVELVVLMGIWATLISMLDSARAVLRAKGHMSVDSAVNGLESLGRLLAVVVTWASGASLLWYGVAHIVEAAVALGVLLVIAGKQTGFRMSRQHAVRWRGLLGDSWAVGVAALATAGFYRIDQVMIQGLAGSVPNGLYGAAARVAFTATVGASLVVMAGYPELARRAADGNGYSHAFGRVLRLCLFSSAASAFAILVGAHPIVHLLYGPGFESAVPMLRVLSIVVLANGVTAASLYSATALGRERGAVLTTLALMVTSLIANALLIPSFGAMGAAWASAIGEVLLALGLLALSIDHLRDGGLKRKDVSC